MQRPAVAVAAHLRHRAAVVLRRQVAGGVNLLLRQRELARAVGDIGHDEVVARVRDIEVNRVVQLAHIAVHEHAVAAEGVHNRGARVAHLQVNQVAVAGHEGDHHEVVAALNQAAQPARQRPEAAGVELPAAGHRVVDLNGEVADAAGGRHQLRDVQRNALANQHFLHRVQRRSYRVDDITAVIGHGDLYIHAVLGVVVAAVGGRAVVHVHAGVRVLEPCKAAGCRRIPCRARIVRVVVVDVYVIGRLAAIHVHDEAHALIHRGRRRNRHDLCAQRRHLRLDIAQPADCDVAVEVAHHQLNLVSALQGRAGAQLVLAVNRRDEQRARHIVLAHIRKGDAGAGIHMADGPVVAVRRTAAGDVGLEAEALRRHADQRVNEDIHCQRQRGPAASAAVAAHEYHLRVKAVTRRLAGAGIVAHHRVGVVNALVRFHVNADVNELEVHSRQYRRERVDSGRVQHVQAVGGGDAGARLRVVEAQDADLKAAVGVQVRPVIHVGARAVDARQREVHAAGNIGDAVRRLRGQEREGVNLRVLRARNEHGVARLYPPRQARGHVKLLAVDRQRDEVVKVVVQRRQAQR